VTPDHVTHYFMRARPPFLNLSEVPEDELDAVLGVLAAEGSSNARRYGRGYLRMRRHCEQLLREAFVAAGGQPERSAPHYFVLGASAWFEGLSPELARVTLPLSALPDAQTSITYPDSFTAMALAPSYGLPYEPKPYHGRVFRLAELAGLIETHGHPDDSRDEDYATFANRPFERYVEVQLWSDGPVREHLARNDERPRPEAEP
jgi:hypothetical protein